MSSVSVRCQHFQRTRGERWAGTLQRGTRRFSRSTRPAKCRAPRGSAAGELSKGLFRPIPEESWTNPRTRIIVLGSSSA